MFLLSLVILLAETGLFAYTWFHIYSSEEILGQVYWNRGNWVVVGIYGSPKCTGDIRSATIKTAT